MSSGKLGQEDIQTIVDAAKKLGGIYERTGFISMTLTYSTSVHLLDEEFKDIFELEGWKVEDFTSDTDKIVHEIDGVKFYALQRRENVTPEPEPEKQETLPAIIMDDTRIKVLKMLIDFYRLREQPDDELDKFLLQLREEVSALK